MELIPVTCNNCGAALRVPDSARFVTCRYCNSQLEIKRTDSVITTEVLQQIHQNTAAMVDDLHALRRDAEVARLDREWGEKEARFSIKDEHGNLTTPSTAGSLIAAIITCVFGSVWTLFAFYITAPDNSPGFPTMPGSPFPGLPQSGPPPIFSLFHLIFPLFGVFVVIGGIVMGYKTVGAASQLEVERREYQRRRRELLNEQPAAGSAPVDSDFVN